MEWIDKMNSALDYIEDNLDKEIDYDVVARKACCSSYNFQRVFSFIADVSLGEYIRRRRLTKAALELQNEDSRVVDVALKYGYDSPVSFARAFTNLHGVTPSEGKKEGVNLKSYPRISFKITIKGVEKMNYRIEKEKGFKLVGKRKTVTTKDGENFVEIPKFWNTLYEEGTCDKLINLCDKSNKAMYGVCYNFGKDKFDYMIAVESDKDLDEKFEMLDVPELNWVKFQCRGKMPEAQQSVWKRIFTEWFPTSGYEHDEGPEIEWYSNEDMNSDNYLSEIWIPIKKSNK